MLNIDDIQLAIMAARTGCGDSEYIVPKPRVRVHTACLGRSFIKRRGGLRFRLHSKDIYSSARIEGDTEADGLCGVIDLPRRHKPRPLGADGSRFCRRAAQQPYLCATIAAAVQAQTIV